MTTVSPGFASAYSLAPQNLYNTEVNAFDKTVFPSPGQVATIVFDTIDTPIGSDITINTDGSINITGNLTYLFSMYADVNNVSSTNDYTCGFVMYDDNASVILPWFPMGSSGTVAYTPGDDTTVRMFAATPANSSWQYPAQVINPRISIQVISGYTV